MVFKKNVMYMMLIQYAYFDLNEFEWLFIWIKKSKNFITKNYYPDAIINVINEFYNYTFLWKFLKNPKKKLKLKINYQENW